MMRLCAWLVALLGCGPRAAPATQAPPPSPPPSTAQHHAHAHHSHADHQGPMHHRFDDAEQWAKVFDDPARDAWQEPDKVITALALAPTMTVADVGAGTGYFTVRLARALPQGTVVATDIEPSMVDYLKKRAAREGLSNIDAKQTPPDDPALAPSSFDRILVVDVWHHLTDRIAYAKKLAAALEPGGQLHVVDFKLDARRGPPPKHRLPPDAILADLRAAGLDASVSSTTLADQYIVVGTRR